jgi:L-seryl-tRNA(Ser) seleniumtransferase
MAKNELLSKLPKVDLILSDDRIKSINGITRSIIVESIRETLDALRNNILNGRVSNIDYDEIIKNTIELSERKNQMHLRHVINATGTVLHTNLGRAVLSKNAVDAVVSVSKGYSNLEYNLDCGTRGSRYNHVEELICKITGCEAAMVVNNNAAAVMLALSTLCRGREAIVSRGQLVEIGGSFRIPAVMELSGAKLVEVGTTNRTHLYDYENAINENTGVILKVHQSNYRIIGFTEEVSIEDLYGLSVKYGMPVIEDIGSGVFIDLSRYGLPYEPTVQNSIKKGIDVVTFSGDKMLGGPQAGIIAGKRRYVDLMKKNQLTRALRIDKMTLAALEATLRLYLDEDEAVKKIPGLFMLTSDVRYLNIKAHKLLKMIKTRTNGRVSAEVKKDVSMVGGGAMPGETMDTFVVSLNPQNMTPDELDKKLRKSKIPVVSRIYKDEIYFDVRTIFDDELKIVADEVANIAGE